MLRLTITDTISHAAKTVNEDLFDHNEQAAWIFDGASGIVKDTIPGAASDPHWLVHTINEELKRVWDDNLPTRDLLRAAAEAAIARYNQLVPEQKPLSERPTACFTMVRSWRDQIEISILGDTGVIHANESEAAIFGCIPYPIAQQIRDERKRLLAAGTPIEQLMEIMLPMHEKFRAMANVDGGYDILDTTTRWVDRIDIQTINVQSGDSLLLVTDGLYRLVDLFEKYDDLSLIKIASEKGLASLYEELRVLEADDPDCTKFPRAKISDDVCAAMITVS